MTKNDVKVLYLQGKENIILKRKIIFENSGWDLSLKIIFWNYWYWRQKCLGF